METNEIENRIGRPIWHNLIRKMCNTIHIAFFGVLRRMAKVGKYLLITVCVDIVFLIAFLIYLQESKQGVPTWFFYGYCSLMFIVIIAITDTDSRQ